MQQQEIQAEAERLKEEAEKMRREQNKNETYSNKKRKKKYEKMKNRSGNSLMVKILWKKMKQQTIQKSTLNLLL